MKLRSSLRTFNPPPFTSPAPEILEAHAQNLWRGIPFAWKDEYEAWVTHSKKVGQELTVEGLEMWMTRVQSAQCPIAGEGCSPPIPVSRFCKHHYDRLTQ